MSRVFIGAALATVALVVPAGWRALDADIQSDGPKLRPAQQTLTVGDATVTLDLDRGIMPAGGKASVTLVATADRPRKVTVALNVSEDMGYSGERVENPPKQIARRTVTLDAQPGGGPPKVETFQLARSSKTPGMSEWFDVVATSPQDKDDSARVGVATWSGNSFAMSIEPPATIPAQGDFTVAVRIKNTTKRAMPEPYVQLGARIGGPQGLDSNLLVDDADDYKIDEVEQPEASEQPTDDDGRKLLAPGAESLAIYHVAPRSGVDHFTFVAQASSEVGAAMATLAFDRPQQHDAATVQVSRR
ncbi:MAG: hypothetical protein ACM31C_07290 [Acidobacteriota bacterium]